MTFQLGASDGATPPPTRPNPCTEVCRRALSRHHLWMSAWCLYVYTKLRSFPTPQQTRRPSLFSGALRKLGIACKHQRGSRINATDSRPPADGTTGVFSSNHHLHDILLPLFIFHQL